MQATSNLLMIRPVDFKFNQQTATNNKFQQESEDSEIQDKALKEFDAFVEKLRANSLNITVIDDTLQPETPDSIFPNNWISFHEDGTIILYPMFSKNRRLERRADILDKLKKDFVVNKVLDLSAHEDHDKFLEGTGSLVLDRNEKIAYACRSIRTDDELVAEFCKQLGYTYVIFNSVDGQGFPIYHTNVMMCLADQYAVICLTSITDSKEKTNVIESLTKSGKEIIDITVDQMNHFAGNMLQVKTKKDDFLLIMSEQAFQSLSVAQIETIEKYNKIVTSPIYTIEKHGGGSARCMLAEIHLNTR
jgi:hypothetical protein